MYYTLCTHIFISLFCTGANGQGTSPFFTLFFWRVLIFLFLSLGILCKKKLVLYCIRGIFNSHRRWYGYVRRIYFGWDCSLVREMKKMDFFANFGIMIVLLIKSVQSTVFEKRSCNFSLDSLINTGLVFFFKFLC